MILYQKTKKINLHKNRMQIVRTKPESRSTSYDILNSEIQNENDWPYSTFIFFVLSFEKLHKYPHLDNVYGTQGHNKYPTVLLVNISITWVHLPQK